MRVSTRDQVICAISRHTSRVVAANRVCRYFVTGGRGWKMFPTMLPTVFPLRSRAEMMVIQICSVRYSFESPFLKIRGPFNRGKVSTRGTRPCETMRIEVGERWLGTKSARDSSSRPFKSAYTRSRLFLHAFLGLCVRVQPLSLVDSRHRCLSHAGMTFRRTCSSWFPRFSFAEKKIEKRRLWIPEEFVFEYIYIYIHLVI